MYKIIINKILINIFNNGRDISFLRIVFHQFVFQLHVVSS